MPNELRITSSATITPYAIIRKRTDSKVWNGTIFENWLDANIGNYDVPLTSRGGGLYTANMPSGIDEGTYDIEYRHRAAASPATTDQKIGDTITFFWTGATTESSGDTLTPSERLALIDAALTENPAGITQIVIDNQTVSYNRKQLLEEREYWARRAAASSGSRPRAASIKLTGF